MISAAQQHSSTMRQRLAGFSLVELSIVLVILGLLVGGVLSGQALIRAAELRAVSAEYSKYVTATQTFRDKYFSYPGDFRDGTRFWGRLSATADCITNSSATVNSSTGVCDGDGDGIMGAGLASQSGEIFQFWRQLAMAGLVEGTYSGVAGSAGGYHTVLGTNAPRSKLNNAGWGLRFVGSFAGNAGDYAGDYGNIYDFGAQGSTSTPQGAVLKPEEAWNIDTKIDDGKPGTGRVIVASWPTCSLSASATDGSAAYKLSETNAVCILHFMRIF